MNLVLLNAAAAIRVASDMNWQESLQCAQCPIDKGMAMSVLKSLKGE